MADTKKMAQNGLMVLGIATAAGWVANAVVKSAHNNLSYEFVSVSFNFNQLIQLRVGADIRIKIKNGNSIGATVNTIVGEVKYGDLKISDVDIPMPITIPAKGEVIGTINLSLEGAQIAQLVADIIAAFQPGGNVYNTLVNRLKFKGIIYTNVVNIPIDMNIPIVVG